MIRVKNIDMISIPFWSDKDSDIPRWPTLFFPLLFFILQEPPFLPTMNLVPPNIFEKK